jgi:hypothetical protein
MSSELAARGDAHWFAKLTLGLNQRREQLGDHITAAENAMQSVKVLGVKTPKEFPDGELEDLNPSYEIKPRRSA